MTLLSGFDSAYLGRVVKGNVQDILRHRHLAYIGISVLLLSQKVEKSEIQEPPRKMKKNEK